MTKKEQAAFAALQEELRIAKAWRFSDPVEPDLPVPTDHKRSIGWLPNGNPLGPFGGRVDKASSSSVSHCWGEKAWDEQWCGRNGSQGSRRLYSREIDAWRALRHQACVEARQKLADIDRRIEELEAQA